jgi:hypothetical protein
VHLCFRYCSYCPRMCEKVQTRCPLPLQMGASKFQLKGDYFFDDLQTEMRFEGFT